MPPAYRPQTALSQLTDRQSRLGGLFQGIFVIEIGWVLGGSFWLGMWSPLLSPSDPTRLAALVTLLTHTILLGVVLMVARAAQGRSLWDLIGNWRQAFEDFGIVLRWSGGIGLAIAVLALFGAFFDPAIRQPILPWLVALPFALTTIFIQSAAEELYFRGYIQSTLAARYTRPVVFMGLPSLFFGLLHWQSGAGPVETTQVVLITGFFGLTCADLTARTGTLGAALGLHFVYNSLLLLVSGIRGEPYSALALLLFPADAAPDVEMGPLISFDLLIMATTIAILWLAARNALKV